MEDPKTQVSRVCRFDGNAITIDAERLKLMSAQELYHFRKVIHTLSDVLSSCVSAGTRFYVDDDEQLPKLNLAGSYLEDIVNWLGGLEDTSIAVGREMKPTTADGIEWRCWLLANFEADMLSDLPELVAIAGQGVKDVADAKRDEERLKWEAERPPQNRVVLQ